MSDEEKMRAAWREGRDYAVRQIEQQIMDGYPKRLDAAQRAEKCPHGVIGTMDCIGCYDEALMNRLSAIRNSHPTDTLIAAIAEGDGIQNVRQEKK